MNIKSILTTIDTILITLMMLNSCNSDVFIDDFSPSAENITLSETDSVSDIYFKTTNWYLLSAYYLDDFGIYKDVIGNIYGPDGNLIKEESPLNATDEKYAKMIISHPYLKLSIDRKDAKHLILSQSENMYDEPKRIYLYVGNTFYRKEIWVEIEPSTRYKLDSIVYRDSYRYQDSVVLKKHTNQFVNAGNSVATFDIYPYSNFKADYSFVNKHQWETVLTEEQLRIFGNDSPTVPIPIIDQYGWPVMSDKKLPLSAAISMLPIADDRLRMRETINVGPNKLRSCTIKCWYQYYGIWYKIYASHPVTGQKRVLEGLLDIYYPQSYEIEYGEEREFN